MHPFLIQTDGFSLPTYGVFYLLAFLCAISAMAGLTTRLGVPFWKTVDIAFQFSIAGEIGARLAFVIVEWSRFREGSISWVEFLVAGRVVLGGVVVGVLAATWLFRRHKLPVLGFLDAGLAGTTLGMGIGRLGCLMSGCCFGKPTNWWWGITFTDPMAQAISGTPLGVPLHPTQILQALHGFVLFGLLIWLFGRRRFDGQVVAVYFMIEGTARFLVEFLRGDPRGQAAGLATSQWIGLTMIVVGVGVWRWTSGRGLTRALPDRPASSTSSV